jgi:hypothetical protein
VLGRELGERGASLGGVSIEEKAEPYKGGRRGINTTSPELAVMGFLRPVRVTHH